MANHIEIVDGEFRLAVQDMIAQLFYIVYKHSDDAVPLERKRIEEDVCFNILAVRPTSPT